MNEASTMTDQINITLTNLSKEIDKYVEFVKTAITEESITQALYALMPLETTEPRSITLTDDRGTVKRLGFQLMRMDVEPPIFNLGLTIDMEKGQNGCKKNYAIYIKGCKTMEEIRDYIFTLDFKVESYEQFGRAIINYYNKD